jgi:hypothetical protein
MDQGLEEATSYPRDIFPIVTIGLQAQFEVEPEPLLFKGAGTAV